MSLRFQHYCAFFSSFILRFWAVLVANCYPQFPDATALHSKIPHPGITLYKCRLHCLSDVLFPHPWSPLLHVAECIARVASTDFPPSPSPCGCFIGFDRRGHSWGGACDEMNAHFLFLTKSAEVLSCARFLNAKPCIV